MTYGRREVYGGLDLGKGIRERGAGYVLAVRSNYMVTLPSGRRAPVLQGLGHVAVHYWSAACLG